MSELFGLMPAGDPVYRVCLSNNHAEVRLLTFGAVIQAIEVPDRNGQRRNVALGLTSLEEYIAHSPHFGAVPGRYAGRIDHGRFCLDRTNYQLTINSPPHTLHGGLNGFGKRNWAISSHSAAHLELVLISPDGEEGFPGTVETTVRYSLDGPELTIDFSATTDAATILNLTNHTYFNLCGEGGGDVFGHILSLDADDFLPIRPDGIPTGEVLPVAGTPFDFRVSCPIGHRIRDADVQLQRAHGYDHAFAIPGTGLRRAAVLYEPLSGRTLTVSTTEPIVHVYTGNNLTGALAGPSKRIYRSGDGICFEAEHAQDAPNHPTFASTTLRPGEPFTATTVFTFGTQ